MGRMEKAAVVKRGYHHDMVGHSHCYIVAHTVQSHPHSVNLMKRCHQEYNQPEHKHSSLHSYCMLTTALFAVHVCFVVSRC